MNPRTAFLAKVLGLYFVLISLSMAANKDAMIQTVAALVHDPPVVFVLGLLLVAAGLAMLLSIGPWTGGALQVVVGIVSVLTLIKGLFFLVSPPKLAMGIVLWGPFYEQFFYLDVAIMFVLGVYLVFAGFKAR